MTDRQTIPAALRGAATDLRRLARTMPEVGRRKQEEGLLRAALLLDEQAENAEAQPTTAAAQAAPPAADLAAIAARAAHLYEYSTQHNSEWDELAGTDVPALLARVAELEKAAVEARAALGSICHDLEDPGTAALGALYLLTQATAWTEEQGTDFAALALAQHDAKLRDALREATEEIAALESDLGGATARVAELEALAAPLHANGVRAATKVVELDRNASIGESADFLRGMTRAIKVLRLLTERTVASAAPLPGSPAHTAGAEQLLALAASADDEESGYRDDVRDALTRAGWTENRDGCLVAPNGALWTETNDCLDSQLGGPGKGWSIAFDSGVSAVAIVSACLAAAKQPTA